MMKMFVFGMLYSRYNYSGNLSEQSKLCNALGEILAESGLLSTALQYHTQDLEISERHGNPLAIAEAHR